MKKRLFRFIACVCILGAAGCNTVSVGDNISQDQANEIVATLSQYGISAVANKDTSSQGKYVVEVKRGNYSQAVSLLHELKLPSEREPSFSELIQQHGLVPNSREVEALRLDHAMAVELEEALQVHPAVKSAKVVVRLNSVRENTEAGVTAVIDQAPEQKLTNEEVLPIILRAVPGVKPENISISIQQTSQKPVHLANSGVRNEGGKAIYVPLTPFLFFWNVPEDDYNWLTLVVVAFLGIVGIIGAVFGYWYGNYQTSKQFFEADVDEHRLRSLRVERPVRKDLPEI